MPYTDRFEGSTKPYGSRTRLLFESTLAKANTIKDDWGFVRDGAVRANIAYALQDVHFDILLVNQYNVFWAPEAMKYKHAIVQVASVVEAVLQYMVKLIEEDPRVRAVFRKEWVFVDFQPIALPGIDIPPGQRAVAGLQRQVERDKLDRNTKMELLIRAAKAAAIVRPDLADELDVIRQLRNRIHIKSLDSPEHDNYSAKMANDALDLLERFRVVARNWSADHYDQQTANVQDGSTSTVNQALLRAVAAKTSPRIPEVLELSVGDRVYHATLGGGVVIAAQGDGVVCIRFDVDGSERRLMIEYAPLSRLHPAPSVEPPF